MPSAGRSARSASTPSLETRLLAAGTGGQVQARALLGPPFLRGQSGGGREGARPGRGRYRRLRVRLTCAGPVGAAARAPAGSPPAMERLTLPPGGAAAVDEYLEYRR